MLIALLIIGLLIIVQLVFTILIFVKIRRLTKSLSSSVSKEEEEDIKKEPETGQAEGVDETETGAMIAETEDLTIKTKKEQVLEAVNSRKRGVTEDDLPEIKKELTRFFSDFPHGDYYKDFHSKDYFRFLDLRERPEERIVVIGDIHCDYLSLAAILHKLALAEYDYFGKAYFVFLGDYLDRGMSLFEPLLLLADLKRILGERMIMLKGNHELLEWSESTRLLKPRVRPHESCDCLNNFCGKDEDFLRRFSAFYNTLPIYVYVKSAGRNILLTHAAVPRDVFLNTVSFDEQSGEMVFSPGLSEDGSLRTRAKVFYDMIWGDPKPNEEKLQVEGRFEFGSKQFERWATRNRLDLLLRSHEEAEYGYTTFFDDKLFTIFSTGGKENPQTGYPKVEPAFGIIQEGQLSIENSFIFKVKKDNDTFFVNALSKQGYSDKQMENYKVGEEFICEESQASNIGQFFKTMAESPSED